VPAHVVFPSCLLMSITLSPGQPHSSLPPAPPPPAPLPQTSLSDGCEVELVPGGTSLPVNLRDVDAYCAAVTQARLQEAAPATRAVLEGLLSVVPAAVLPILTARELELMVCGTGDVDVDLLQRNTEYDEDGTAADTWGYGGIGVWGVDGGERGL
jgi:hypothetical protein